MAKKKSLPKSGRKPTKKPAVVDRQGRNGEVKTKRSGREKLTHERLRKLAKKHRPPDAYFVGDIERPW